MKRLYLLRHAQALSVAPSDKERPLSETGRKQAQALHAVVKTQNYAPDFIACSPALRTRQTMDLVYPDFKAAVYPDEFFYTTRDGLLSFIQEIETQAESLAIVNHNPTIQELAFALCDDGDEDALDDLAMGYAPGTLSVIDCPIDNWSDLKEQKNTLKALIPPAL